MPSNKNRIISLQEICTHKSVENQTDFVGIRYDAEKKQFFIDFPIGYLNMNLPENGAYTKAHEKILRKDILNLIHVLSHSNSNNQTSKADIHSPKSADSEMPIYAYLHVIHYYLKHGYYKQKESVYKTQKQGKINWNRTIKRSTPLFSEGNAVYLDFVVKKETVTDDALLTIINKYCVYEAFKNIGCLLTSFLPKDPHIECREKLFVSVLKGKIAKTFNDQDRLLFLSMLDIIKFNSKKHDGKNFFYGTNEFHVIWEKMIDERFGTDMTKTVKDDYHPHISWKLFKDDKPTRTPLIPDTIMIPNPNENNIYILDAKYYKYSYTHQSGDQPLGESVPKQIVYGDRMKLKNKDKTVYNAFILPSESDSPEMPFGFAYADWKEKSDLMNLPHNRIQEVFIGTRELMYNHTRAGEDVCEKLAKIIENGAEASAVWVDGNVRE